MNEVPQHVEAIDSIQLVDKILTIRELALTSPERNVLWVDEVNQWNEDFRKKLIDRYGSTKWAQQVPAWQVLIGGTAEGEVDITDEVRTFILAEVDTFSRKMEKVIQNT
jgi:hypothetical protein